MSRRLVLSIIIIVVLIGGGTYYYFDQEEPSLLLATTTSVENTGLLDLLIVEFEKSHNLEIKVTARGTGAAVDLAKNGDADAILVHAKELEETFVTDGFGLNRTVLWYNYFVLVGPQSDPANIQGMTNLTVIFENLLAAGNMGDIEFYSRGDNSGTHIKELSIWESANIDIESQTGDWYKETGAGMSSTLITTNENQAYTLSDAGTFLQLQENDASFDLISFELESEVLFNPYSYIPVSKERFSHTNFNGALDFLEFLKLSSTIHLVRNFQINGQSLFIPIEDLVSQY